MEYTTSNALSDKGERAHFEGRRGPPVAKHRHVNNSTKHNPTTDDPWTHQTKDNHPQDTKLTIRELSYTVTLMFPIPSDIHIVPSINDIPSTPGLVEALEHSFSEEDANIGSLQHMFPSCLDVHDEFIPNKMFNLRLISCKRFITLQLLNETLQPMKILKKIHVVGFSIFFRLIFHMAFT